MFRPLEEFFATRLNRDGLAWRSAIAARRLFLLIRTRKMFTSLLGPVYHRSRDLIEIDVTYACNLRCHNCNRSCRQAPSSAQMSVAQIERFVSESISRKKTWTRIRLLGGEPLLHPEILQIVEVLRKFRAEHTPGTELEIVTNGLGRQIREVLEKLPQDIRLTNTAKSAPVQSFQPFNLAPRDLPLYRSAAFSNGCRITSFCGIGLNGYGYYPCAVAAGIDRVLGLDRGRKTLPDDSDDLRDQLSVFCSYCGFFLGKNEKRTSVDLQSESWQRAYADYEKQCPKLMPYG